MIASASLLQQNTKMEGLWDWMKWIKSKATSLKIPAEFMFHGFIIIQKDKQYHWYHCASYQKLHLNGYLKQQVVGHAMNLLFIKKTVRWSIESDKWQNTQRDFMSMEKKTSWELCQNGSDKCQNMQNNEKDCELPREHWNDCNVEVEWTRNDLWVPVSCAWSLMISQHQNEWGKPIIQNGAMPGALWYLWSFPFCWHNPSQFLHIVIHLQVMVQVTQYVIELLQQQRPFCSHQLAQLRGGPMVGSCNSTYKWWALPAFTWGVQTWWTEWEAITIPSLPRTLTSPVVALQTNDFFFCAQCSTFEILPQTLIPKQEATLFLGRNQTNQCLVSVFILSSCSPSLSIQLNDYYFQELASLIPIQLPL